MRAPRAAFSTGGTLALVVAGFALFLAFVWLIAAGDSFGGDGNNGEAHAGAKGLNGYTGLVRLAEANGYEVERSRSPEGLETDSLLVLTPPYGTDSEELGKLLRKREQIGPTLVILPKWTALRPPPMLPSEVREKFEPGWVILGGAERVSWPQQLPEPYFFTHVVEAPETRAVGRWKGFRLAGTLPTATTTHAAKTAFHEPLVTDAAGRWLAMRAVGKDGTDFYEKGHWTVFVAEPDLVNNYGLSDRQRAALAMALLEAAAYDGDAEHVTFDLTLNGFGASENLLTLAFRPPFLAATLCLLLALLINGWRAFGRFGPATAGGGPAIAFGKKRLIANSAGLILRARRFHLLGAPYAALSARRLAERLGLPRAEPAAIDAALAYRLPLEEPFSRRAARLEAAEKPADILSAAQALDDLTAKL